MSTRKELIVYFTPQGVEPPSLANGLATIAAASSEMHVQVSRQEDFTLLAGFPAVGIEVEGLREQIVRFEASLEKAGYRVVDGSRQVRALDREGGNRHDL